ncbi:MAG: hypothetical protein OXE92_00790 [Bacteroidetes bacterium]|nr:hypothetical protein [Bacteroidota bacterium]MCY4204244.1 hypothetical protein [Bacteroidota bacterium]
MGLGTAILLTLIGYFILKAGWRLYRVVEADQPKRDSKPKRPSFIDDFGREQNIENARWRDLPQN